MQKEKAVFCWSGGKDSALCLYEVLKEGKYEVCYLLTTINENFKRISMHGVREELLEVQSASLGIKLIKMYVSEGTNSEYENRMEVLLLQMKAEGIEKVIFGDIFLEDLRKYREDNLSKIGMKAVFPLWKKNTADLIRKFFSLKFRTITCCINDQYLGKEHAGSEIDEEFIRSLPAQVDPCGENGEFHTFCFDGPVFKEPIAFAVGEKVYKPIEVKSDPVCASSNGTKGFWFCDLIPV